MGRKIKSNKNIGRKWKDPETYFSQVLIKDKFKDIDNLDESVDDLPPGQKYMLVSFVEPDPGLQELWECFTFGKFLMKAGNTIVKKAFEKKNMEFLLKQYKNYKQINHKYINKEFAKKYGKDYDHRRIFKIYGVYPDVKTADKKKDEIAQDNKHLGVGVFRQQMGFFVPFNPSIEDCKDFKSTNKSMNELMGGQMMHTRGMKSLYNERKKILREKYIKDQEENGGSAKLKEVIDSDGKKHSAEEYLKNSDKRKMTKEEIDE